MEVIPYPSHKELCPKCSHNRRTANRSEKCLTIWDNGYRKCHNCGDEGFENQIASKPEYTKPCQELPEGLPKQVIDYFANRGINYDILMRNKISYDSRAGDIIFPYIVGGEILNKKYRKLNEKRWRQEKNARKSFYGTDDIVGETDVYIVEGEIDKLSFEAAGFINVVSVPDGAPNETAKELTKKLNYIAEWKHLFENTVRIIIAVDSDKPGKKLQEELIDRLGSDKCYTIDWPKDCKDANAVLTTHGVAGLMTCIDRVKPIPINGLKEATDFGKELDHLYTHGLERGYSTGWKNLDEFYTVKPGTLTVITGVPSHGKSSWVSALLVNLAQSKKWKFALYSPENLPLEDYIATLSSLYTGKPFGIGVTARMTPNDKGVALNWLSKHFYFIDPEEDERTDIEALLELARACVKRYNINGLVLDPWNEIDHTKRAAGISETEYISHALGLIKRFARKQNVHVWVVAHPTKLQKEPDGSYAVPKIYDVAGSAHWANKSDAIISVWRNVKELAEPTAIHIFKARFKSIGKQGEAKLDFDIITGRFKSARFSFKGATDVTQEKPQYQKKGIIPGEQGKGWQKDL